MLASTGIKRKLISRLMAAALALPVPVWRYDSELPCPMLFISSDVPSLVLQNTFLDAKPFLSS
jgi:hypothetical protein